MPQLRTWRPPSLHMPRMQRGAPLHHFIGAGLAVLSTVDDTPMCINAGAGFKGASELYSGD